jgi:Ca-activated chloride channel family protein
MTFASPTWLLALALVPIAIGIAVAARRRAKRYAIRFTAISTAQAAAAGGANRWRHLPAIALLAAIAALAIALARPHVSYSVPVRSASIMLVSDESGSMAADDVSPTRLAASERAANQLIGALPGTVRIGAITFSNTTNAVQAPATDHAAARAVIDAQTANGGTNTGGALQLALQLLGTKKTSKPVSAIVLLSDGAANEGPDPVGVARQAAAERIPIYTVALGTARGVLTTPDPFIPPQSVPPDPQLMQEIAQTSHGRSFNARTADELSSIYAHLGSKLGSAHRTREITADFAIAGLLLLLLAAAGSARWSQVLP